MSRTTCFVLLAAICIAGPVRAQSVGLIQQLNDKWAAAFNKGDATAVAAMYTSDAYVLPPGSGMVKGRNAIEAFWRQAATQFDSAKLVTVDLLRLGPRAAREIGTVTLETKAQPSQQIIGKYAVLWRDIRGHWLIATDIWNTDK
jgi:uncharacterized protein (TIGR02246 family)